MNFETNDKKDEVKKNPYFDKYRNQIFEELNENHSLLFNFFLENNDFLKKINKEDEEQLINSFLNFENKKKNFFFLSLGSVFLIDQVIFRYVYPFSIKNYRISKNLFKYFFIPFFSFGLANEYYKKYLDVEYFEAAQKYNFNINDFNEAFDKFEKVHLNGDLENYIDNRSSYFSNKFKINN